MGAATFRYRYCLFCCTKIPCGVGGGYKWAGIAAGALILLAVLVWWILMPETMIETSAGMGVWMTVLGGVLGVVAGVLAFLDQK